MNNPRAFPSTRTVDSWNSDDRGMTLRDYFAARAMQGLCSNTGVIFGHHLSPEHPEDCKGSLVESAYRIADAMLAARDKPVDTAPPKP
jgi:hypothetical protein